MLYLYIWNHRLKSRWVVYHILTTVYESFIIEIDEDIFYENIRLLIESISFFWPVDTWSHFLHLILYISSIFTDPIFTFFHECCSPDFFSRFPFLCYTCFYFCLSRYTSMICTRYPESRISLHSMVSYHDIFEREHERMSDMEISCYIWRGYRYIKCLSCTTSRRQCDIIFLPELLHLSFAWFWIVLFWKFWHRRMMRKIMKNAEIYPF